VIDSVIDPAIDSALSSAALRAVPQNHRFRFIQRMMPVARAPMEPSARK
jgi:hypothetical protein